MKNNRLLPLFRNPLAKTIEYKVGDHVLILTGDKHVEVPGIVTGSKPCRIERRHVPLYQIKFPKGNAIIPTPLEGTIGSKTYKGFRATQMIYDPEWLAKKNGFKPYRGPGGPSEKDVAKIHKALAKTLAAMKVPAAIRMIANPFNPTDIPELEVVSVGNKKVSYDRWGFCDFAINSASPQLDQARITETVLYLMPKKLGTWFVSDEEVVIGPFMEGDGEEEAGWLSKQDALAAYAKANPTAKVFNANF